MRVNRMVSVCASVGFFLGLGSGASVAQQRTGSAGYNFYFPGGSVNTINNTGWVMGSESFSVSESYVAQHATVWIDNLQFDLGTLGGLNSAIVGPVENTHGIIAGIAETTALDPLGENWSCSASFPSADHHVCLGFRYAAGEMVALPTLGGLNGYASGVNRRGHIVGWAETTTRDPTCIAPQVLQFKAVHYGADGKAKVLPPLPEDSDSAATAVNDAGQAVGVSGSCDAAIGAYTARHAVIWQDGVAMRITTFGGQGWNMPMAINERGHVVGFADLTGDVVGGTLKFNPVGFIWSAAAGTRKIEPLPGDTKSMAYAINDHNHVVGQSFGGLEGSRAFLWRDGVAIDLNDYVSPTASFHLLYADGINDLGEIIGRACFASQGRCAAAEDFLAVPVDGPIGAGSKPMAAVQPLNGISREMLYQSLRQRGFSVSDSVPAH